MNGGAKVSFTRKQIIGMKIGEKLRTPLLQLLGQVFDTGWFGLERTCAIVSIKQPLSRLDLTYSAQFD
jgi:hypothetical protein